MKTTAEKIAVMQAFLDGVPMEILTDGNWSLWLPTGEPEWRWGASDYRVKPEPREWWANEYADTGGVYLHDSKELALKACRPLGVTIKVREVIE
jgi:hypothetical protein